MGKSIRSKIKKKYRSQKRLEQAPLERTKRALQSVRLGALPAELAPGASPRDISQQLRCPLSSLPRCAEDTGVPNEASSKPKRFTFNPHLANPAVGARSMDKRVTPASLQPKVGEKDHVGRVVGAPNGNPARHKPKPEEEAGGGAMETEVSASGRKSWRSVLRQRIKKKHRARRKKGWGEIPSVLLAPETRDVLAPETRELAAGR